MKSIKTKLIIYFSIIMLLSSTILGIISLINANTILKEEAEQNLLALTNEGAKTTQSRIEVQKETLQIIAGMEEIQSMDLSRQQLVLQKQLKNTNFMELGVIDQVGLQIIQVEILLI